MKKILSLLVPLFLVAAMTAGDSFARQKSQRGPGGDLGIPHGSWWQRAGVKEQLKLTEKQVTELEKISQNGRKDMVKLRAQLELISIDLEPIMDAKTFDRKAAESILNRMEDIRAKMAKQRTKMLLDTREILSYSQYQKLKEIRGGGRKGGKGQRPRAQGSRRGPRGNVRQRL
jgi:Spy/CpxP family protein refolding chaperone